MCFNGLNNTVAKGTLDDKFKKIDELRNEFTTEVNNLQGDVTKLRNDVINTPVAKSKSDIYAVRISRLCAQYFSAKYQI